MLPILTVLLLVSVSYAQKNIIIDTDGLLEDARAVGLALTQDQSQNVRVLAITTVSSAVEIGQVNANVMRLLRLLGRTDIPVYQGADDGIVHREREGLLFNHGSDGLGDKPQTYPAYDPLEKTLRYTETAVDALVRMVRQQPGQITIVATGPLTNIAQAIQKDPYFAKSLGGLYILGGAYLAAGNVASMPNIEYNFHMDPEAAKIVLDQVETQIVIVPIETCKFRYNGDAFTFLNNDVDLTSFFEKGTRLSMFYKTITQDMLNEITAKGRTFWLTDMVAMAAYLSPEVIVRYKETHATVETNGTLTRGMLACDWVNTEKTKNVKIITQYDLLKMNTLMNKMAATP